MIVKIKGTDDVVKFPDGTDEETVLKALQGYMGEQTSEVAQALVQTETPVETPGPVQEIQPEIPNPIETPKPVEQSEQKPPEAFARTERGTFVEIPDIEITTTAIHGKTGRSYEVKENAKEAYARVNTAIKNLKKVLEVA